MNQICRISDAKAFAMEPPAATVNFKVRSEDPGLCRNSSGVQRSSKDGSRT